MLSIAVALFGSKSVCRLIIDVAQSTFVGMSGDDFARAIEDAHHLHICDCERKSNLVVPLCVGFVAVNFEPRLCPLEQFSQATLDLRVLNDDSLRRLREVSMRTRKPEERDATYHAVFVTEPFSRSTGAKNPTRFRAIRGAQLFRRQDGGTTTPRKAFMFREVAKPPGSELNNTHVLAVYMANNRLPPRPATLPAPERNALKTPQNDVYVNMTTVGSLIVDKTGYIKESDVSALFGSKSTFARVMSTSSHTAKWLASVLAAGLDLALASRAEETVRHLAVFQRISDQEWSQRSTCLILLIDFSNFVGLQSSGQKQWDRKNFRHWLSLHLGESMLAFLLENFIYLCTGNDPPRIWARNALQDDPSKWLPTIIRIAKNRNRQLAVWIHGLETILMPPMATAGLYINESAYAPVDFVIGLVHEFLFKHLVLYAGGDTLRKGIFSAGVQGHGALWKAARLDEMLDSVVVLDILSRPQSDSQIGHGLDGLRGFTVAEIRHIGTLINEHRLMLWCERGLIDVSGCASRHNLGRSEHAENHDHSEVYDPAICIHAWTTHRGKRYSPVDVIQKLVFEQITGDWQERLAPVISSPLLRSSPKLFNAASLATAIAETGWTAVDDPVPATWPRGESCIKTMCGFNESPSNAAVDLMVWAGVLQPITTDQAHQYATTGQAILAVLARIYDLEDPSSRIELGFGTRRSLTDKEAEGLIQPLLVEARSWFDGVTQKLYDEFAQRTSTSNPPRNEDELQIWLVAAMKHPETGLHIRLRRKILAEAGVDLNSFRITCMVEVWLCWAGKNRCLDWNTHVDLSPNCKLSLAGEFKYIPRPWNKELGKSDNPSAKYAISAVPWLTKDHRTEFLPAKDEIVDGRKWSLAEPKLDGEIDYSPPDEDRGFPSPLISLSQLRFSTHQKVKHAVHYDDWDIMDLTEENLLKLGQEQMTTYGKAFLGELQPISERAGNGIRDQRYRVLEHTGDCRVHHFPHLFVFIAGGALLLRFNGTPALRIGAELVVSDPFTPALVTGRKSEWREAARTLMNDTAWTVSEVPLTDH